MTPPVGRGQRWARVPGSIDYGRAADGDSVKDIEGGDGYVYIEVIDA